MSANQDQFPMCFTYLANSHEHHSNAAQHDPSNEQQADLARDLVGLGALEGDPGEERNEDAECAAY